MNKLIKKLAAEAGFNVRKNEVYTSRLEHFPITDDLEEFAELVIRECAGISENYAGGSLPLSIALTIKRHFGIEE